jgi:prepilin-type N-terminal cleavage/methylation domain-containing protein
VRKYRESFVEAQSCGWRHQQPIDHRGFTLLEMLVAIAIVGTVIAMAISPSQPILVDKSRFMGDEAQLRGVLQQARNIARNRQECVQLNITGNVLSVTGYSNLNTPCPAVGSPSYSAENQDPASVSTSVFNPAVTLTPFSNGGAVINPLIFNTQGGTDSGNFVTMTISRSIYTSTYKVMPLIGQIENY